MSHVCLSSGLLKQCQSSVRFSSLCQPITWDVVLYRESRAMGAAPSTSLAMVSPSAAATLWLG